MTKKITVYITAVLLIIAGIMPMLSAELLTTKSNATQVPVINYRISNYKVGNVKLTIRDASQLPANSTYVLNGIGGAFPTSAGNAFLEFGEYPRTYVGNTKNTELESLVDASGDPTDPSISKTGNSYTNNSFSPHNGTTNGWTNNSGAYQGRESFEYEYQGKRYVRHKVMRFSDGNTSKAHTNAIDESTGELYDGDSSENSLFSLDSIAWFYVEPIRWLIANWNELPITINPTSTTETPASTMQLLAIDEIMAGVPHAEEAFYYPYDQVLWENSRVRTFLNGTTNDETREALANIGTVENVGERVGKPFIAEAFTAEERELITTQNIRNSRMPETYGDVRDVISTEEYEEARTTQDKIFFLSYNQVFGTPDTQDGLYRNLFDNGVEPSLSRIAANTDWAFGNYAWSNDTTAEGLGPVVSECNLGGAGAWWLRSAWSHNRISRVFYDGSEFKCYTYNPSYGMRPAMYLSIENMVSAVPNANEAAEQIKGLITGLAGLQPHECGTTISNISTNINTLLTNLDYFNKQDYSEMLDALENLNALKIPANTEEIEAYIATINSICYKVENLTVLSDFVPKEPEEPKDNDNPSRFEPYVIMMICGVIIILLVAVYAIFNLVRVRFRKEIQQE